MLVILLVVLAIIGVAYIYFRTSDGRYQMDKLTLRLPLFGRIKTLNELSRCCRSISLLIKAGLSLPEIMPLVTQGSNNRVIAEALSDVHVDMLKGEGLSQPMARNSIFLVMAGNSAPSCP